MSLVDNLRCLSDFIHANITQRILVSCKMPRRLQYCFYSTVKLGYNELAYNEHPLIVNKKIFLVGLGEFTTPFSWL